MGEYPLTKTQFSNDTWHTLVMAHITSRRPGRPCSANPRATRERIVRAARDVFTEIGYDAASFQLIANRADLTRPSVNHYFVTKSVLYREVVEQATATVIGQAVTEAQQAPTLLAKLSTFFGKAMDIDSTDRSTAAFLVASVWESRRHPDLVPHELDVLQSSREFVAWAVNDAIDRGELDTGTDVGEVVEMLLAMMWGLGLYAGFSGGEELDAVVDKFELMMTNKLCQLTG
jgi:AcrR family transcriptional regulator